MAISNGKILRFSLAAIAAVLIAYGAYGLLGWWQSSDGNVEPVTLNEILAAVVTDSTTAPDETEIDTANPDYRVAPDMPRRIILPSIDIIGFVQQVGLDQNNAIAVPSNIHLAGWYIDSAKPGQPGLSIIDGHVSGRYHQAIFKNLHKMQTGDSFSIEYGDGSIYNFEVISINDYSVTEATAQLFESSLASELKLITCGGTFDSATEQFDRRIIVSAELLSQP